MTAAREIAAALGGKRVGRGWSARCPAHDDRHPSLSIAEGPDGKVLVYCHAGCTQKAVIAALKARALWPARGDRSVPCIRMQMMRHIPSGGRLVTAPYRSGQVTPRPPGRDRDDAKRIAAARALWAAARSVTVHDAAGQYLASRGLPGPWPPALRFAKSVRHPSGEHVPALVAAASRWPGRTITAVQVTGLTPTGAKASLEPARWTRGALRGAGVWLAPPRAGAPIVITEGTEDGLAARAAKPEAAVVAGAAGAKERRFRYF